jgi:NAD(P)-dependent dehydrogenase (short-subunit alcohol dehydrogenase family)
MAMLHIDGYVLARALVYAVASIDGVPEERRTKAVADDRDDMVHILNLMITDPAEREQMAAEVEAVTGRLADLTAWSLQG